MGFDDNLAFGKVAESKIAEFLYKRGCSVLPVYDLTEKQFCGPQLFTSDLSLVAPDILTFTASGDCIFVEAKHKRHFTWWRIGQRWQTGIDAHHFDQYLKVQELTATPVWLLFLHCGEKPSASDKQNGCPELSPTGLYGDEVRNLTDGRISPRHGKHGMRYWDETALKKLCDADAICGPSP